MQPCNMIFSHKKDYSKLNGTSISPYLFYVMQVQHCQKKESERIRAAKPLGGGLTEEKQWVQMFQLYILKWRRSSAVPPGNS